MSINKPTVSIMHYLIGRQPNLEVQSFKTNTHRRRFNEVFCTIESNNIPYRSVDHLSTGARDINKNSVRFKILFFFFFFFFQISQLK